VALGVASFGSNISSGNYGAAALDGLGVVYDGIATAVPVLPGFAGASLKAKRAAKALESVADKAGDASKNTPRANRRQAMRKAGIPTSQQPTGQRSFSTRDGKPAGRQYDYEGTAPGGGSVDQSVQHSLTDRVPGHRAHWEAGTVKSGGQRDSLGRPRLQSDKSKVNE